MVSPNHDNALLLWKSPYVGLNANIVARVVSGRRDTFYVVAIIVEPVTPDEKKIGVQLRKMLESFHTL